MGRKSRYIMDRIQSIAEPGQAKGIHQSSNLVKDLSAIPQDVRVVFASSSEYATTDGHSPNQGSGPRIPERGADDATDTEADPVTGNSGNGIPKSGAIQNPAVSEASLGNGIPESGALQDPAVNEASLGNGIPESGALQDPDVSEESGALQDPAVSEDPAVSKESGALQDPAVSEESGALQDPAVSEASGAVSEDEDRLNESPGNSIPECSALQDPAVSEASPGNGIPESGALQDPAVSGAVSEDEGRLNESPGDGIPESGGASKIPQITSIAANDHGDAYGGTTASIRDAFVEVNRALENMPWMDGVDEACLQGIQTRALSPDGCEFLTQMRMLEILDEGLLQNFVNYYDSLRDDDSADNVLSLEFSKRVTIHRELKHIWGRVPEMLGTLLLLMGTKSFVVAFYAISEGCRVEELLTKTIFDTRPGLGVNVTEIFDDHLQALYLKGCELLQLDQDFMAEISHDCVSFDELRHLTTAMLS